MKSKLSIKTISASIMILILLIAGSVAMIWLSETNLPQESAPSIANSTLPSDARDGESILLWAGDSADEYFAANYFPTLTGAKADGLTDDTEALQAALDRAGVTGGTVYLPGGIYRVKKPLIIPTGVTLRGDFTPPDASGTEGIKTILLAEGNAAEEEALLTVNDGGTIIGITVYYENQSFSDDLKGAPCIECNGAATLKNISLINPDFGISFHGEGTVVAENLWIAPLKTGIRIHEKKGAVKLEHLHVTPTLWINYAPADLGNGTDYPLLTGRLLTDLVALDIRDGDVFAHNISVETAATGLSVNAPYNSDGTQFWSDLSIINTTLPVHLKSLSRAGICVGESRFRPLEGSENRSVHISAENQGAAIFSDCVFSGIPKTAIKSESEAFLSFYHCDFGTWWNNCFDVVDATFLVLTPTFRTEKDLATLGQNALGLLYGAPTLPESEELLFSVENTAIKTDIATISHSETIKRNGKTTIYSAADYGVVPDSENNADNLNALIKTISKTGGIIFFAEGVYTFDDLITVPDGVRLVGVGNGQRYRTVLRIATDYTEGAYPLRLEKGAILEHLVVEEHATAPTKEATFAVGVTGDDVLIQNVTIIAKKCLEIKNSASAQLQNLLLDTELLGLLASDADAMLQNVTVTAPKGSIGSGICAQSGRLTLCHVILRDLSRGIVLQSGCNMQGENILIDRVGTAVYADHTGTATFLTLSVGGADTRGSCIVMEGTQAATGTVTAQRVVCKSNVTIGGLISAEGGTFNLSATILATPFATVFSTKNNASVTMSGSILDTEPARHVHALGGSVRLSANLLRSNKTFEGISGDYILVSAESTGTVRCDYNMIKHIFTESNGENMESGSKKS